MSTFSNPDLSRTYGKDLKILTDYFKYQNLHPFLSFISTLSQDSLLNSKELLIECKTDY